MTVTWGAPGDAGAGPPYLVRPLPDPSRSGGWFDALAQAVVAEQWPEAVRHLEVHVLGLLGRGDLLCVRSCVAALPARERTLLLRAADADAATRAHCVDLAVLDALEEEASDRGAAGVARHDPAGHGRLSPRNPPAASALRAFIRSTRAHHFLWRGDPLCLAVAVEGLAELPEDGLLEPIGLVARGRLNLVAAMGLLFMSFADNIAAARERVELAAADFRRAGFPEDAAVAAGYFHAIVGAVTWTDVAAHAETVAHVGTVLENRTSAYAPLARAAEALLRLIAGQMWEFRRAIASARTLPDTGLAYVRLLCDYLELVADLVERRSAAGIDARAERLVTELDRHSPELAGSIVTTMAVIMLDIGDVARATSWKARGDHLPQPFPTDASDRLALRGRLAIAHGDVSTGLDDVRRAADDTVRAGLPRCAGVMLARAARVLRSVGADPSVVTAFMDEARSLLGAPQTIWESLLLGPAAATGMPRQVRIAALAPDVSISIDGTPVVLGNLHARIIGYLLAMDRPVTDEELIDAVWPEADLGPARRRLAVALHRLRKLTDADVVVRDQAGLRLAGHAEGCGSDVADLLDADPSDPQAAAAAALAYRNDFVARQLAYDEFAVDARRWLRARFVRLACGALSADADDAALDADTAVALALCGARFVADDPELARLVEATLDRHGRRSEAAAVREAAAS